jgi:hypothetical protein
MKIAIEDGITFINDEKAEIVCALLHIKSYTIIKKAEKGYVHMSGDERLQHTQNISSIGSGDEMRFRIIDNPERHDFKKQKSLNRKKINIYYWPWIILFFIFFSVMACTKITHTKNIYSCHQKNTNGDFICYPE